MQLEASQILHHCGHYECLDNEQEETNTKILSSNIADPRFHNNVFVIRFILSRNLFNVFIVSDVINLCLVLQFIRIILLTLSTGSYCHKIIIAQKSFTCAVPLVSIVSPLKKYIFC